MKAKLFILSLVVTLLFVVCGTSNHEVTSKPIEKSFAICDYDSVEVDAVVFHANAKADLNGTFEAKCFAIECAEHDEEMVPVQLPDAFVFGIVHRFT